MDMTVADIQKLDGQLTAWCASCRKLQVLCGPGLVQRVSPGAPLAAIQPRLKCKRCGKQGELWISFPTREMMAIKGRDMTGFNRTPYDPNFG